MKAIIVYIEYTFLYLMYMIVEQSFFAGYILVGLRAWDMLLW